MKKNNSRIFVIDYDKYILVSYLSLIVIGLILMLDLSSVRNTMVYFYRQLAYAGVSTITLLFILKFANMEKLRNLIGFFLVFTTVLLVLVLVIGVTVKGGTRSIKLGPVSFQPSFLARIVLIFFYANIIDKKREELSKSSISGFGKNFLPLLAVTGIVYFLIFKGQHLSSLIISGMTLICLLFLGGLRFRIVAMIMIISVLLGFAVIKMGASYRSERLNIYKKYCLFFKGSNPSTIPEKEYQVRESLTALTSGKFFGTGTDRGMAKHYYLPEARTDYIFTIIGEQYGFLGAIIVFGLHCFLFFRIMLMAYKQTDFYHKLFTMGLALNIFLNVLVNVGVSMSILPSTGNTLPFISYSGTAMLIDSITIGLVLNVSAKRKVI
jgi:cell division protein FtsW (lipid II flippase)